MATTLVLRKHIVILKLATTQLMYDDTDFMTLFALSLYQHGMPNHKNIEWFHCYFSVIALTKP